MQLQYMDCDSFVLSIRTQNKVKTWKILNNYRIAGTWEKITNYSVIKIKKVVSKFKTETPKNIWVDKFIAFRSKACSFKCNNEITKKMKSFLNLFSKHKKMEE